VSEHLTTQGTPGAALPALRRLRAEALNYVGEPFVLTVTVDGAPHCGQHPVEWAGEGLVVPAPRHWPREQAGVSRPVTVLYPPATPDGYALIIDGTTTDTGASLTISVTRAVLHRRGRSPDDGGTGCGSDCVPLVPAGH
jgi:hypothetical protein